MSDAAPVAPPPQPPLLKRAFGNRTGMGFVGGTILVATATPQPGWWELDWLCIGGLIAGAGALFRLWASGYLEKNVQVATKGPYRLVRHPLYLGSIILWIGLLLMAGNPWFAAPAAIGFYIYHAHAIRREEEYLIGRFGEDYVRFRAALPALLPVWSWVRLPRALLDGGFSPALAWRHREWHVPLALAGFWVALWGFVRAGRPELWRWWTVGVLAFVLVGRLALFAVIDRDIQNPVVRFLIALVSRKGRRDRARRLIEQQQAADRGVTS